MSDFSPFWSLFLPLLLVLVVAFIGLKTLGIVKINFLDRLFAPTPLVNGKLSPEAFRRVAIVFVVFFWFLAIWSGSNTASFLKTAQRIPGEITNKTLHSYRLGRHGWGSYAIEVQFTTADGNTKTVVCREEVPYLLGFVLPEKGEKVMVLCNPRDLAEVSVDQFGMLWGSTYCYFSLGVLLLLLVVFGGGQKQESTC